MGTRGWSPGRFFTAASAVLIFLGGMVFAVGFLRDPPSPTFEIPLEEFVDGHGERIQVAAREALIRLKPSIVQESAITTIRASAKLDLVQILGGEFIRIRSRTQSATALVKSDVVRSLVSYVGPNHILYGSTIPNDTYFDGQWGLYDPGSAQADIRAVAAWDLIGDPDASDTTVAVLDSGIRADHEDLKNSLWSAPRAFSITVGDRSWSCGRNAHGVNVLSGGTCSTGPVGSNGHGTKVAGIVGAAGNNGQGVTGVAWKASLLSVVVMDSNNHATEADIATGVDAAIAINNTTSGARPVNVRVISISIATYDDVPVLEAALQRANAAGILVVAAAGNDGNDNDGKYHAYPASYDSPNIVSVAATNKAGELMRISNFGLTSVDLAAPGHKIYTTEANGGYGFGNDNSGTSVAVPFVSGAAALLFAKCPGSKSLTPSKVRDLLMDSVDKLAGLKMKVASEGRLNLYKALRACGLGAG